MPAYFESGFVVREPAWHGLATVLDSYPDNWGEARRLAGLDWEPVESPVYVGQPLTVPAVCDCGVKATDPSWHHSECPVALEAATASGPVEIPGWKAVTRSDTNALLHIHQDSYELFPNAELGPMVEALLDETDVQYETAGVLRGGRQVWVMLRLAHPFEIPGDPAGATLSYLALQNSHDGSGALRAQRLQTRIVCSNTSAAADREAGQHGMEFTFRHTRNMRDRIEDAKAALAGLRRDRGDYRAWAHELLGITVTDAQREEFITRFIPEPATDAVITPRVRHNIDTARAEFRGLYATATMPEEIHHTAYGLVQASTEYLDHVRKARSAESRFNRSVLSPDRMKHQAEKLAREVASV